MKIQLPKNWNDVSLFQYIELTSINSDDFSGSFDMIIEQISILSGIDIDDEIFDDISIDELFKIIDSIKWVSGEPPLNFKKNIDDLRLININKIKLGEFIDIEYYSAKDLVKNIHIICSILYKRFKTDEWGNDINEPYIYNLEERGELFLDLKISDVYGVIKYYSDFKAIIMDKYSIVFNGDSGDIEDLEGLSDEEIEEIKREEEEEKKKSIWAWPSLINNLSNGDITKYDDITDLPLTMVLNELVMRKVLDIPSNR